MTEIQVKLVGGGKIWDAGPIVQLAWILRTDMPCEYVECTVPGQKWMGKIDGLKLLVDGKEVFDGIVDKQVFLLSGRAAHTKIYARSRIGALLLDNEARAKEYRSVYFSDIVAMHGTPYGVRGFAAGEDRRMPLFATAKGMSEWEALAVFARQAYGADLHIDSLGKASVLGRERGGRIAFSNSGGGVPYGSLEVRDVPYEGISQVFVIQDDGSETVVRNPGAGEIQRRRFLTPSTQWALFPRTNAEEMIMEGEAKRFSLILETPGILSCSLGSEAGVEDMPGLEGPYRVEEIGYYADTSVRTRLVLR